MIVAADTYISQVLEEIPQVELLLLGESRCKRDVMSRAHDTLAFFTNNEMAAVVTEVTELLARSAFYSIQTSGH